VFLFTFHQASGKRKAVEDGPWMFNDELLVMEEFDENKSVEEYNFESIPIWVRIFNLPLGRMNRDTGEAMGDVIGKFIEVEVGDDGMAFGQYLRVKVRMMIDKPLMRGMIIQVGENGREKWCRFEYEYLPDFCFTCGILGHTAKGCSIQLKKGEVQQYGNWLKCVPRGKAIRSGNRLSKGSNRYNDPRNFSNFGSKGSGSGSESLSWRKESIEKNSQMLRPGGSEKERTGQLKLTSDGDAIAADGGNVKIQQSVICMNKDVNEVLGDGKKQKGTQKDHTFNDVESVLIGPGMQLSVVKEKEVGEHSVKVTEREAVLVGLEKDKKNTWALQDLEFQR
jgi:hypothetical protein